MGNKKKKKKGIPTTLILIIVFVLGLSLLLYPSVSNYWNSFHASVAISSYAEKVEELNEEEYDRLWNDAVAYNKYLADGHVMYTKTEEDQEEYEKLLNLEGSKGVMGYIEIPTIDVSLPIYHGVSDEVLQTAVGHVDWSSLPVGGKSTHCVLSGHRGLPRAKLFTNLDKLIEGDIFILRILDEILTYEIDQILIVEPEDISALQIEEGKDYCTLVTCTPYGINTHRMLVRGHRIENIAEAEAIRVTADAVQIESYLVAVCIAVPVLLISLIVVLAKPNKKKENKRK